MSLRNFWLTAWADGRETPVGIGPRRRDGGMKALLTVRNNGVSHKAIEIEAQSDDEQLALTITLRSADGHPHVVTMKFDR